MAKKRKRAGALRTVSLYTGCGGLDFGFEAAGFETYVGVEFDRDSVETIKLNRNWPMICRDIHDVPSDEIMSTGGLKPGDVDMLIGGPPCQPFSKSSYWVHGDSRRLEDPRATTLHAYMRCVEDMLPEVFLLENVHGISYSGKEEGFELLMKLTEKINKKHKTNYQLSWKVLNAADYGVPQLRVRFFLVGHRDGGRFTFPAATHAPIPDADDSEAKKQLKALVLPTYVTAWDAIGGYKPTEDSLHIRGSWADLLPSIPEGENYLWHTNRKGGMPLFGWRTRYWSFLLKLAKRLPSWTIQSQPGASIGPFHWESRLLAAEEMARIQTFPHDLEFAGGRTSIQKQIGNAVPSLLAEVLARAIAEQFFGVGYENGPERAVKIQRPIPKPEKLRPVPVKFLDRVGEHPDHPGEGKGAASKKRLNATMQL
ncbi:MAG: DNA (cytosine-5-)-methyltransferase [Candidatus Melainabacteria bacterium]|jgi:DNA (cytosine-5)-methyltransferase 1|nr:DNA (cytosine-5-)-methyltransferase [Candidatus Melainabacteria bacterium]